MKAPVRPHLLPLHLLLHMVQVLLSSVYSYWIKYMISRPTTVCQHIGLKTVESKPVPSMCLDILNFNLSFLGVCNSKLSTILVRVRGFLNMNFRYLSKNGIEESCYRILKTGIESNSAVIFLLKALNLTLRNKPYLLNPLLRQIFENRYRVHL